MPIRGSRRSTSQLPPAEPAASGDRAHLREYGISIFPANNSLRRSIARAAAIYDVGKQGEAAGCDKACGAPAISVRQGPDHLVS